MRDKIPSLEVEKLLKSMKISFEKKRLYTGTELVVMNGDARLQLVSKLQLESDRHFYFDSTSVANFFLEMGERAGHRAEKAMELFDVPAYKEKYSWVRPEDPAKGDPKLDPHGDPKLDPHGDPKLDPHGDHRLGAHRDPKLDPHGDPRLDPKHDPRADRKGEHGRGSKPHNKPHPEPPHGE